MSSYQLETFGGHLNLKISDWVAFQMRDSKNCLKRWILSFAVPIPYYSPMKAFYLICAYMHIISLYKIYVYTYVVVEVR